MAAQRLGAWAARRLVPIQSTLGTRSVTSRRLVGLASQADVVPLPFPNVSRIETAAGPLRQQFRFSGSSGPAVEQKCPALGGESITEGTLMEWRKKPGEFVAKGEVIAVIETDKVTVEINADMQGILSEIVAKEETTVEPGMVVAKITPGEAPAGTAATAVVPPAASPPASAATPALATASPAAPTHGGGGPPLTGLRATFARLAAQRLGLPWPPAAAFTSAVPSSKTTAAPAKVASPSVAVSGAKGRTERRVPVSRIRQRVIQRIKDTQNSAALLTTFQEADMSAALSLRSKYKEVFQKTYGAPFGLLSLFAKASACAMMEERSVNAVIDDATTEVVHRDYVDISVPIPTPRGPVYCVLRNVESMSIVELERTIAGLAAKAGKDLLSPDEMMGPTFGIIDSGSAGGMLGTAIPNPPQSAVLGTNSITKRPAAVDGKVVARPIMNLSLTYDHRLIDGREAVTFLCSVRDKMEDPCRMLIGL